MDLTTIADKLQESYNCELEPADTAKELSNLADDDIVYIHFPDSDESLTLSVKEIASYLDSCDTGRLVDNLEYFSVNKYLLRIEPFNENAIQYFWGHHYDLRTTTNVAKYGNLVRLEQELEDMEEPPIGDAPTLDVFEDYYQRKMNLEREINRIRSEIEFATNRYCQVDIEYKDHHFLISVISGASEFGLMLAKAGDYEKWDPPTSSQDLFVEIVHDNRLKIDECRLLADKYMYELSTQIGLIVSKAARITLVAGQYRENSELAEIRKKSLLPFLACEQSKELYSLYCKAVSTIDNDFAILKYTQIIEFVSQTVSRIQMYDTIRGKLEHRDSISPSLHFIEELRKTYDRLRLQTKDSELIRMTIQTCCDISLFNIQNCKTLQFLKQAILVEEKKGIKSVLDRLACIIYATRNQIAHAKMNYQATGNECPSEDEPAFIACLKSAAEQCIRWFESQPEWIKYGDQ